MISPTIIGLVNNIALLLALGLIYDMVGFRSRGEKPSLQQVLTGIVLGTVGIALMLTPWELTPGLFFDARSILLGISGLFFGTIPTLIAVSMTAALRFSIGGSGVWPGIAVIITSGVIGIAWRHLRKRQLDDVSIKELYIFGLVIHITMVLWMLALPWPLPLKVVPQVGMPVMVIHPIGTALLGWLMISRQRRKRTEMQLQESEGRYRALFERSSDAIFLLDTGTGRYLDANLAAERISGRPLSELLGLSTADITPQNASERLQSITASKSNALDMGEVVYLRPDGSERTALLSTVSIQDGLAFGLARDITERKQADETLRESRERYLSLFNNMLDGIYRSTHDGKFVDINPAMVNMFGYSSREEMLQVDIRNELYFAPEERGSHILDTGQEEVDSYRMRRKDGSEIWVEDHGHYVHDEQGRVIYHEGILRDITERRQVELGIRKTNKQLLTQLDEIKELQEALHEQALRDPLTGLFNRRYMVEALQQELAKAMRKEISLSVVMLDFDNLKEINDLCGHVNGGDKALQALAGSIQSLCRASDTFCRYAGDEFVIILYDTSLPAAYKRTSEWRDAVAKVNIICETGEFGITFSAGISGYPSHGITGNELLQQADKALYQAKEFGRNRVVMREIPNEE